MLINNAIDIKSIDSEAGVIASVLLYPELIFFSENLSPEHFTDPQNAAIYYAVSELAKKGVKKIDAYNVLTILNAPYKPIQTRELSIDDINGLIDIAPIVARTSPEEYKIVVGNVLNAAFRRETFVKLCECQKLCFNADEKDIEHKIYKSLDEVMMDFSTTGDIPQYKDVVDELWSEIEERQGNGMAGIPFKFETLNQYATIEPGELFIFAAEAKQGKSMMLLNCAVDLLKRDLSVLYIDSELNSRMFTCRLVAHLTGIEFNRVKSGHYSDDEKAKIEKVIRWLKTKSFTHLYIPMFDLEVMVIPKPSTNRSLTQKCV